MNENLNLVEILKNEPIGRELYSPMYGYVYLHSIDVSTPLDIEESLKYKL